MSRQPNLVTRGRVLTAIRSNPGASYRELADMVGVKSVSVIAYHIKELRITGDVHRGDRRSQRTTVARTATARTNAKKAAGGRKARILENAGKGPAGLDRATWARIEKIGQREDARRAQLHSTDVVFDFHHGAASLKCSKLG